MLMEMAGKTRMIAIQMTIQSGMIQIWMDLEITLMIALASLEIPLKIC